MSRFPQFFHSIECDLVASDAFCRCSLEIVDQGVYVDSAVDSGLDYTCLRQVMWDIIFLVFHIDHNIVVAFPVQWLNPKNRVRGRAC